MPDVVFEQQTGEKQILSEGSVFFLSEKIEYNDKGIFQYLKGAEYPQKGFPEGSAIFAVNVAKRLLIAFLSLKYAMLPTVSNLEKILRRYNEISLKIISPYILKPVFLTPLAREFGMFTTQFLYNIGVSESVAVDTGKIVACMFEYDNAYRFRLQDLFTSTTKRKMMSKPYKEICYLLKIQKERDSIGVHEKFKLIKPLIFFVLLVPKFRKAYKQSLSILDFKQLQFDEIDEYWVSMRTDYDYYGEDAETRSQRNINKKMPTPMPVSEFEKLIK